MLLTSEQEMIRDSMRAFSQERLAPFAAEWDKTHTFPAQALRIRRAWCDGNGYS